MLHVELAGKWCAFTHKIADVLSSLSNIVGCLVLVRWVIEDAVFQQVILEISRVEFAHERAIHVEGGDTIFYTDEIGGTRIGDVLNIIL